MATKKMINNIQSKKPKPSLKITDQDFTTLDVIFFYARKQCAGDEQVLTQLINYKHTFYKKLKEMNSLLTKQAS